MKHGEREVQLREGTVSTLTLKQKNTSENMEAGPAGLLPSVLLTGVPPAPMLTLGLDA